MGDAGIFHPKERVELIEGEIITMAPIGSQHSSFTNRLTRAFVTRLGEQAIVQIQNPVVLSNDSESEPDIAILKPRHDFYRHKLPKASDVLLIIEVADTSIDYDADIKIPLYARNNIPEVWIFDIHCQQLVTHTKRTQNGYQQIQTPADYSQIKLSFIEDLCIDLSFLREST